MGRRFTFGVEIAFPLAVTAIAFGVAGHWAIRDKVTNIEWILLVGMPCGAALLFTLLMAASAGLAGHMRLELPAPLTYPVIYAASLALMTLLFVSTPNALTAPVAPIHVLSFWLKPISLFLIVIIQTVLLVGLSRSRAA